MVTYYRKQQTLFVTKLLAFATAHFLTLFSFCQETNTQVFGIVKSNKNETVINATVTAVHEPTRDTYSTQTNSKGYFYFFNIKPGGPYIITISYIGLETFHETNLFVSYSGHNFYRDFIRNELVEFVLNEKNFELDEVTLEVRKKFDAKYGVETNLGNARINMLPSVSRNLQDYVRVVPNAKVNSDGGISLAGQNNKYNAFFIDGSNTNDLLGLANSGTAGGQTSSPPISVEAIEEILVLQSPYDVQYSNFTGGSINALTKSGSNQYKSSVWFFFRNEKMAGRSPVLLPIPGTTGVLERPRLSHFFNQTAGVNTSGAITKNKLFYFLLAEHQTESQPQPYNFEQYKGNSKQQDFFDLVDTLLSHYHYDPGSFLESANVLDAKRFVIKLDWNPDLKNKFTLSYRYNGAERTTQQMQNSSTVIRFSNNRYRLPSTIHSTSFEWKKYFKHPANNRLLLTYNSEVTQRRIIGQPFPQVLINDGVGVNIAFGSSAASNTSRFTASAFSLLDVFRFAKGKNSFSAGANFDYSRVRDLALGSYFGSYRFNSLTDFFTNAYPSRYTRNVSLVQENSKAIKGATAKYNPLRVGVFLNDEVQVNVNLKLNAGIRIDANALPLKYPEDEYFNTIARYEIQKYYDLEGALSGKTMKQDWSISPRFGFNYRITERKITIRGGAGFFSGHILNVWASQLYSVNIATISLTAPTPPQYFDLHFNSDPFNQPSFQSLGIDADSVKGTLALVSHNYKYPYIFRTSVGAEKMFKHNWSITTELLFTKNFHENRYTNLNILPPSQTSISPGTRNIYSSGFATNKLPMPGGNPYSHIFLLSNNHDQKGYSYSFLSSITKTVGHNLLANLTYSLSHSVSLFEPVGNANTTDGQWLQLETVNGKNFATRSISDFDIKHRVTASITKQFNYGNCSTIMTLFYEGQSGSPFSYVYDGSIINDDGRTPTYNSDLIYIPTKQELERMIFIANTAGGITYSPQQQKDLLNNYIEQDKYLRKHRGDFAQRNGARLPFTHLVDLRFQQNFSFTLRKRKSTVSIVYDIFNFANMLNKNWGRTYFLSSNDNFALMTFAGFATGNALTPQYQFKPIKGKPWSVQNSTAPGSSARWISQLGLKVSL